MKLKNIGKIKMNNTSLDSMRKKILNESKIFIVKNGWNENLFDIVANNSKFTKEEILALFPNGYLSLLNFYLFELNRLMTENSKKLDLIRMKTHLRIREIILLRLRDLQCDKPLFKRTFFTLMLPQNHRLFLKSLYITIDQMWFIAGDSSTDFNFYSKRAILAGIYSSVILYWINNKNFDETSEFLDKQLKKVSKIPRLKNHINNLSRFFPQAVSIFRNFSTTKQ